MNFCNWFKRLEINQDECEHDYLLHLYKNHITGLCIKCRHTQDISINEGWTLER